MIVKFYENFLKETGHAFPELKFNSATYFKAKHELIVRFIISTYKIKDFLAKNENAVFEAVQKCLPGVKVNVEYIRTYADDSVVKNKVMEFFNRFNQMIFKRMKEENIKITISDEDIEVALTFETGAYTLLTANDTVSKLTDYLDDKFNYNIIVTISENVVDTSEYKDEITTNNQIFNGASIARLVKIEPKEKIYARGRIEGIGALPNYIMDIDKPMENVILCGKISGVQQHEYTNKKYNPDDPKSGPQKLPMFRFTLDDTTKRIETVCFPRVTDAAKIAELENGDTVVCLGKTSISTYNGMLSFAVDAIFRASIDFNSIQSKKIMPVPERYTTVKPKPFEDVSQSNMFEDHSEVPAYMKDKTFVVFDFEATDKMVGTAIPIELSAVKIVDGVETEVFETFVNPGMPIPPIITELTTIDDEMVKNAPTFDKVLPDFYKFTRGAILVGHNIENYDFPLLSKFADKEGYNFNNDLEDTLLLAREYLKNEMTKFDLVSLSKRYGFNHENAHRAISDVYATCDLLRELSRRRNAK